MKLYPLILLLLFGCSLYGQKIRYPKYNMDSILTIAWRDTGVINSGPIKDEHIKYCEKLRSIGNDKSYMFPHSNFNTVKFCEIIDYHDPRLFFGPDYFAEPNEKCGENTVNLTQKQIEKLLYIINNPLNYGWSECGSPTPEFEFIFIGENGEVLERLVLSCDTAQIVARRNPEKDFRMKFGAFHDGRSVMSDLIYEIKQKYSSPQKTVPEIIQFIDSIYDIQNPKKVDTISFEKYDPAEYDHMKYELGPFGLDLSEVTEGYQYYSFQFLRFNSEGAAIKQFSRVINADHNSDEGLFRKIFSKGGSTFIRVDDLIIYHRRRCNYDEKIEVPREEKLVDFLFGNSKPNNKYLVRVRCGWRQSEIK